jgi:hypothetical protein
MTTLPEDTEWAEVQEDMERRKASRQFDENSGDEAVADADTLPPATEETVDQDRHTPISPSKRPPALSRTAGSERAGSGRTGSGPALNRAQPRRVSPAGFSRLSHGSDNSPSLDGRYVLFASARLRSLSISTRPLAARSTPSPPPSRFVRFAHVRVEKEGGVYVACVCTYREVRIAVPLPAVRAFCSGTFSHHVCHLSPGHIYCAVCFFFFACRLKGASRVQGGPLRAGQP